MLPLSMLDVRPIAIGDRPPLGQLRDRTDAVFDLKQEAAGGGLALIFFRGGWCPYCSAQFSALRRAHAQFQEAGLRLLGVSTDSLQTLKRHDHSFHGGCPVVADPHLTTARAFGVAYQASEKELAGLRSFGIDVARDQGHTLGLLVAPSVFLLSETGSVQWRFVAEDPSKRLDAEALLAQLQQVRTHGGHLRA